MFLAALTSAWASWPHARHNRAVLVDADMADAQEVDAGDRGVRYGIPAGTAILRPFDRVPPAAPFEARVAGLFPGLDAPEESLEREV
jgi:hypothetical protein